MQSLRQRCHTLTIFDTRHATMFRKFKFKPIFFFFICDTLHYETNNTDKAKKYDKFIKH